MNSKIRNLDWWIEGFLSGAGLLLIAEAMVRFMVAGSDSQLIYFPDAIFGISLRQAILLAGLVELVTGLLCLFSQNNGTRFAVLAWLMTNWSIYQMGLASIGTANRYSCVGLFTDPLHISGSLFEFVLKYLPIVLLVGAYAGVLWSWIAQRRQRRRLYVKVACPGCGGHIEFPVNAIKWKIACPHCRGGVRPQNLPKIA